MLADFDDPARPSVIFLDSQGDSIKILSGLARFDPEKVRADLPKTAVYQDIAHWFVYAGFAFLITGIAVRRI